LRDVVFKTEPMEHQVRSIDFALKCADKRCCFWLDIGTGKTLAALYTVCLWKCKGILVVCPSSVIRTWREEIRKHTNLSYVDLSGIDENGLVLDGRERRRRLAEEHADVYLLNYEGMKTLFAIKVPCRKSSKVKVSYDTSSKMKYSEQSISGSLPFDCVVVDESDSFKSYSAVQTRIGFQLSKRVDAVLMLTGTPLSGNLADLWAQFWVLDLGKTLGNHYYSFLRRYFTPVKIATRKVTFTDWVAKKGTKDQVLERVAPRVIRFDLADCVDLPPSVYEKRDVMLTSTQREASAKVLAGLKIELQEGRLNTSNIANKVIKLCQITGGFIIGEGKTIRFKVNPKLDGLWECIRQTSSKCIVYHTFVEEGRMIEGLLRKKKIKFRSLRGEITDKDGNCREFKDDPSVKVLVAHPKSGGIGQNLQVANVMIFYSVAMMSAAGRKQTKGRIYRRGQDKTCVFIDLVARGSIDEATQKALEKSGDTLQAVLDWVRNYTG